MFKAKLKIILEDDWTKHLITKFNTSFKSYYFSHLDNNTILDIIVISIKQKEHNNVINFLKKENTIKQINKLDSQEEILVLKIITKYEGIKEQETNSSIILKNDCFIDSLIEMIDGWEIFTIISHDKKNITKTIRKLQKTRETQLISIKKIDFQKEDLTKKQYDIIKYAYKTGFFDFPKQTSTKQISNQFNLNDSSTIAHIKKAEKKIISNFLRE